MVTASKDTDLAPNQTDETVTKGEACYFEHASSTGDLVISTAVKVFKEMEFSYILNRAIIDNSAWRNLTVSTYHFTV